jgi:hypothetical protein
VQPIAELPAGDAYAELVTGLVQAS